MRCLISLLITFVISTALSFGQARFSGKVVEVIDGRTLVVETSAGKIKAQLQFVETPEADQPL